MQAYQRGAGEISGGRAHYSDHEDEVAEADRERREILIRNADKLHNSLAEALLGAEALDKLAEYPDAAERIRTAAGLLKDSAYDIEPRRHLRRPA